MLREERSVRYERAVEGSRAAAPDLGARGELRDGADLGAERSYSAAADSGRRRATAAADSEVESSAFWIEERERAIFGFL